MKTWQEVAGAERAAITQSALQHLEASKHNLSRLIGDNRLIRRISPIVIPAIILTNIWLITDFSEVYASLVGTPGILITLATGLLIYALWKVYAGRPR